MRLLATKLTSIASAVRNLFWGASLNMNFAGTDTLDPRITFTRASTGTRVNASGVMVSEAINGPRFDYDPVTLQPKGLLIEEQRTNIQLRSEEFDVSAVWGANAASVTANTVTSPSGTSTADTIAEDTASNAHGVLDLATTVTSGVTYTFSVYAKAGTASVVQLLGRTASFGTDVWANFNLSTGSIGSVGSATTASIESVNNGWYRCSIRGAAVGTVVGGMSLVLTDNNATAGRFPSYVGSGKSLYVWGAQLEAGAFPTSYIPTTTAAATRAADVAVITGANFSNWYRQDEGTLFAEGDAGLGNIACFASIDDTTTGNRIQLRRTASDTFATFRMVSSGGSIDVILLSGSAVGVNKQAASFSAGNQSAAVNGTLFTGITSITPMPITNRLELGNGIGSASLNGHIRRIAYFPRRLTNSELQGLTS